MNFQMFKLDLEKAEEPEGTKGAEREKISNAVWENFPEEGNAQSQSWKVGM